MTKLKATDSFISALVEETYRAIPEGEATRTSGELFDYFQKKGQAEQEADHVSLVARSGLDHWPLIWNSETHCYRLVLGKIVLDFPQGWSLFESALEVGWDETGALGEESHLLQVLSPLLPNGVEKLALAISNDGAHLVAMRKTQDLAFLNLRNAFLRHRPMDRAAA